jgi:hypothetical protein
MVPRDPTEWQIKGDWGSDNTSKVDSNDNVDGLVYGQDSGQTAGRSLKSMPAVSVWHSFSQHRCELWIPLTILPWIKHILLLCKRVTKIVLVRTAWSWNSDSVCACRTFQEFLTGITHISKAFIILLWTPFLKIMAVRTKPSPRPEVWEI